MLSVTTLLIFTFFSLADSGKAHRGLHDSSSLAYRLADRQTNKHEILARRVSRTYPARKRQASSVTYPICEGSPSSGEIVYGVMTNAIYAAQGQSIQMIRAASV